MGTKSQSIYELGRKDFDFVSTLTSSSTSVFGAGGGRLLRSGICLLGMFESERVSVSTMILSVNNRCSRNKNRNALSRPVPATQCHSRRSRRAKSEQWVRVGERERERERERGGESERERETDRQTDREEERQREGREIVQGQRDTDERERERERERESVRVCVCVCVCERLAREASHFQSQAKSRFRLLFVLCTHYSS